MDLLLKALIFFCLWGGAVNAQDEKTFRDILTFEERGQQAAQVKPNVKFKVRSHRYYLDLNNDIRQESFYTAKRDGTDWLHVFSDKGEEVFRYAFSPKGPFSRLFKVQMRKLSKNSKVLLLYFYEGVTRYIDFKGTARVYFLTIDDNNLKTMAVYKGPSFWVEFRDFREHYHQRKYEVSLFDFDKDLVREVAVRYDTITRVYKYLGKGKWWNFDDKKVLEIF